MTASIRPCWALIALWALAPATHAFSFTNSIPSSCDDLSISWTGGTPPFQMVLAPLFGTPRNVTLPAGSFSNGQGQFILQLPFAEKQRFVITMSDAVGYATGGTTEILTTAASKGGICDTKDPGVDFSFELNSALQQCRPYIFSNYLNALQPVTIIGTIPGGTSFVLRPPTGSITYSWVANVEAGTSILFTMIDSQGRNGGTSDVKNVGITDDSTCLNGLSPSSTPITTSTPTPTPTKTTNQPSKTPSATPSDTPPPEENKTSIAAIAGTVIGALVFLAVTITMGLFCLRKRRDNNLRRSRADLDLTYDPPPATDNHPYPSGAAAASASPLPLMPGGGYDSNPFLDNPHSQLPYQQSNYGLSSPYLPPSPYQTAHTYASSQYQTYQPPSQPQYGLPSDYQQHGENSDPFNPYTPSHVPPAARIEPFDVDQSSSRDSMSTAQRKAALAGVSTYTPSRFIVHTDVEDELPPPNSDGVVELPPQYSERRAPSTNTTPASSSSTSGPLGS